MVQTWAAGDLQDEPELSQRIRSTEVAKECEGLVKELNSQGQSSQQETLG